jgi:predicted metal-dependent phosphoesterase TrpH
VHSDNSDGSKTIRDGVREAKNKGLKAMAFADHDTTRGLSEFMEEAKSEGIETLSGVEISCRSNFYEMHILGYGIDFTKTQIIENFFASRKAAYEQTVLIVLERYANAGIMNITVEDLRSAIGFKGYASTMHIAAYRHLIMHATHQQVKDEIRKGGICREKCNTDFYPTTQEAIEFIKSLGGIAVLAHSARTFLQDENAMTASQFRDFIINLKKEGISGLEVYHPSHSDAEIAMLLKLTKELNLLVTGGSDDHGVYRPHGIGSTGITYEDFMKIKMALS